MNRYISDKLTVLSTVLIIMVVYVHSSYSEAEQYTVAKIIQDYTSRLCGIANCLFFCISGYLFARDITSYKDILIKIKKRVRTLLIPYVLWNIIFVLWYIVLESIPGVNGFCNGSGTLDKYVSQSIIESMNDLFVSPAAFQLWFLRDLLIMMIFTPVFWWLSKNIGWLALLIAGISTLVYPWLLYFWVGIFLSTKKIDIYDYWRPTWFVIFCALVFSGYAVCMEVGMKNFSIIGSLVDLIGLYAVWTLYDILTNREQIAGKGLWKYISGYSFFIYCFHEPTFNIVKKLAIAVFGVHEFSLIFFYYLNPWIMVFIAIYVAKTLQHIMPLVYNTLMGGR